MGKYKNYASEALQLLSTKLSDVSEDIYFDIRPDSVDAQKTTFIVINSNNRWNEKNVLQYTLMNINRFYRAKQHNIMPVAKTQEMVDAVLAKLPISQGRYLFNDPFVVRICKSDGLGFGYATIQVRCNVNTTDKFQ